MDGGDCEVSKIGNAADQNGNENVCSEEPDLDCVREKQIADGFAEASLMLSSALEQLDGIIAGSLVNVLRFFRKKKRRV